MRSDSVRRVFALLTLLGMLIAGYGTCNAYERHSDENDCLECVTVPSVFPHGGEDGAPSLPHHCPNHPCSGHLSLAPDPGLAPIGLHPVAVVPFTGTPAPKLHSLVPPDEPPRA